METAFYLAGPEVAANLFALVRKSENDIRTARRIANYLKAKDVYWSGGSVAGFQFKEDPGPRFCRLKGTPDGWKLRRSVENRMLLEKLGALETLNCRDIGHALELKPGALRVSGRGFRVSGSAGMVVAGDKCIVEVEREDGGPKGCTRISDIERERLIAASEKNPKRKKRRRIKSVK